MGSGWESRSPPAPWWLAASASASASACARANDDGSGSHRGSKQTLVSGAGAGAGGVKLQYSPRPRRPLALRRIPNAHASASLALAGRCVRFRADAELALPRVLSQQQPSGHFLPSYCTIPFPCWPIEFAVGRCAADRINE
jgi:hypothetical protein